MVWVKSTAGYQPQAFRIESGRMTARILRKSVGTTLGETLQSFNIGHWKGARCDVDPAFDLPEQLQRLSRTFAGHHQAVISQNQNIRRCAFERTRNFGRQWEARTH